MNNIETEEALRFWASRHMYNEIKSIIAFSADLEEANNNLRRFGYKNAFRKRMLEKFGEYVNQPDMKNIPYSTGSLY